MLFHRMETLKHIFLSTDLRAFLNQNKGYSSKVQSRIEKEADKIVKNMQKKEQYYYAKEKMEHRRSYHMKQVEKNGQKRKVFRMLDVKKRMIQLDFDES